MKAITKSEELVDFKEKLIFEEFKDRVFKNTDDFRKQVKIKHNIVVGYDLYTKIQNYQIKKYGRRLDEGKYIEETTENQRSKTKKRRMQQIEHANEQNRIKSVENRTEKRLRSAKNGSK